MISQPPAMARGRQMSLQDRKDHLRAALPITTAVGRTQPVEGPHRFLVHRLSSQIQSLLLFFRAGSAVHFLDLEPLCFQIIFLLLPLLFEATQTAAQFFQDTPPIVGLCFVV